MKVSVGFLVPVVKPTFTERNQISGIAAFSDITHDIHEIEDHDSVMRDAYGYLSIVDTAGRVFLYPASNVVKVEIIP